MFLVLCLALVFLLAAQGLNASPSAEQGKAGNDGAGISARGAIGALPQATTGPMYEGDGGKDIRLAILAPEAQGDAPNYLPVYTQGLLNNNFKKYSGITLTNRQDLDKIIAEQNLAANGRFSDKDFIKIGELTNVQYFLSGTIQKLSGEQYSLRLSVTGSSSGEIKASFMKNGTLAQIENGSLINQASADLLAQLGVRLSGAGRQALLAGNTAAVRVETGLAKGITAEAGGASVEALFNFTQAAAFDPSQMEALARLATLSSSISGGSLSERIVNDIQARDRWLAVFKDTARFYNEHPPFEIIFDPALIQEGETDYAKRTANLAMRVSLTPSDAGFAALNALVEGLEKTGRRSTWGFAGWPLEDIKPKESGAVVFGGKRAFSFKVDAELFNDKNKSLGKGSITLNSGNIFRSPYNTITAPEGASALLRFPNVRADELTPVLTIAITAVNGIAAQKLNAAGYMRIDAGNLEDMPEVPAPPPVLSPQTPPVPTTQRPPPPQQRPVPANMVRINGGTFTMGSPVSEAGRYADEGPRHQITVSSFYLGKYEVTQAEYGAVMGYYPSSSFRGPNLPVENVSWYDAVEYCNKRSEREGLTPAYTTSGYVNNRTITWNRNANGYRLPTEAEWEYACRAGTTTPYYSGSSPDNAGWYYGNSGSTTHPVGQKQANAWGLYDMHGNVWEWCWDWYGDYPSRAQTDPSGPSYGSLRVGRGGSWSGYGRDLRSALRFKYVPSYQSIFLGFRLARNAE